jgi:hypothetical protein
MFPVFRTHCAPKAALLFSSGPAGGQAIGEYRGEPLYHGSLDTTSIAGNISRKVRCRLPGSDLPHNHGSLDSPGLRSVVQHFVSADHFGESRGSLTRLEALWLRGCCP